jgi:hypothetical protein
MVAHHKVHFADIFAQRVRLFPRAPFLILLYIGTSCMISALFFVSKFCWDVDTFSMHVDEGSTKSNKFITFDHIIAVATILIYFIDLHFGIPLNHLCPILFLLIEKSNSIICMFHRSYIKLVRVRVIVYLITWLVFDRSLHILMHYCFHIFSPCWQNVWYF